MRALEIHDVARATSCIACALEIRSSNVPLKGYNYNGRLLLPNLKTHNDVPRTDVADHRDSERLQRRACFINTGN